MTEIDLRILGDDGAVTVVSVIDIRTDQTGGDGFADDVVAAIDEAFDDRDDVIIER